MANICTVKLVFYSKNEADIIKVESILYENKDYLKEKYNFEFNQPILEDEIPKEDIYNVYSIIGYCRWCFKREIAEYICKLVSEDLKYAYAESEPNLRIFNCYDTEDLFFHEGCRISIITKIFDPKTEIEESKKIVSIYETVFTTYAACIQALISFYGVRISHRDIVNAPGDFNLKIFKKKEKRMHEITINKFRHIN